MAKRLFDIFVSALGLIFLAPVFLLIAILIKATSPGPVFYMVTRVGRGGSLFSLYKFRSMVENADQMGPGITGANDQRITPIGRFLRRSKLDELPQLLNVFIGDMSLVGPRPEDPRYVALYTAEQRQVLELRPGITSLAAVQYRHEEQMLVGENWEQDYIDHIMPAKLAIDLANLEQYSFPNDIVIILRTFASLFR